MGSFWSYNDNIKSHCFNTPHNLFNCIEVEREWQEEIQWKLSNKHRCMIHSVCHDYYDLIIPKAILNIVRIMSEDPNCIVTITRIGLSQEIECINIDLLHTKSFCHKFWGIKNELTVPTIHVLMYGSKARDLCFNFIAPYDNDYESGGDDDSDCEYTERLSGIKCVNGTWFNFDIYLMDQMESPKSYNIKSNKFINLLVFDYGNRESLNKLNDYCKLILNKQHTLNNCIVIGWIKVNHTNKVIQDDHVSEFCDKWTLDCINVDYNLHWIKLERVFAFAIKYLSAVSHFDYARNNTHLSCQF